MTNDKTTVITDIDHHFSVADLNDEERRMIEAPPMPDTDDDDILDAWQDAIGREHALRDAIAEEQVKIWERLLTENSYRPVRLAPHEVREAITLRRIDPADIVYSDDDGLPYWQEAWDLVDVTAVVAAWDAQ